MKCQILFSRKNKKNITNLPCAKLAKRVVMIDLRLNLEVKKYCKGQNLAKFYNGSI